MSDNHIKTCLTCKHWETVDGIPGAFFRCKFEEDLVKYTHSCANWENKIIIPETTVVQALLCVFSSVSPTCPHAHGDNLSPVPTLTEKGLKITQNCTKMEEVSI